MLFVFRIAAIMLNTHISVEGKCPYNVSACFKIATGVGLVRYDFDQVAVRGPHLTVYSLSTCVTTMYYGHLIELERNGKKGPEMTLVAAVCVRGLWKITLRRDSG